MTKKISISLLVAATLFASSCDKKLNLQDPQAIDATTALSTDDRVKKVLIGNYAALGSASLYGGDVLWMSELLASDGELTWVGTFPDPRQIWGKNMLVNNSNAFATYAAAYRVIYNSNNILANLSVVKTADQPKVEGEAKFQRALAYFELVKFFGEKPYVAGSTTTLKGVPVITTPGPSAPQSTEYNLPRASVEAVYQQVIQDLTDAESKLPNTNGVYANKPSAQLALARVYLQQAKYTEARDAANRCITAALANGFSLVSSYGAAFNNAANTREDLFAMQYNLVSGTNSCFTYFSTGTYGARDGDIEVTDKHMNKYAAGDTRKDLFFFDAGAYRVGKWRDNYRNVKVFRLAEAYLTRAECNARLGQNAATVAADIKLIRDRAGLPELAAPTLAQILNERELELAFEGQGIWDAKRLKLSVDGRSWDDPKLTFPMPLRERNINGGLDQNPGYN
ncbi:MAG: RagB/SusD family nutrient uptake outer membrane protein [Bacteroidetes bacterium]|uniref:RagB/SusD family nutrient uptake outer membrane protein n=1 Tax=Phnomibacter sp. TaxID=2836217 RepID=UPI002FDCC4A7|nr:RagB/SusD family nutrient uptake outer membrane protein [Bacteroidota bacterium]